MSPNDSRSMSPLLNRSRANSIDLSTSFAHAKAEDSQFNFAHYSTERYTRFYFLVFAIMIFFGRNFLLNILFFGHIIICMDDFLHLFVFFFFPLFHAPILMIIP